MVYDFHTHTSLSDGSLSPMELIQRAQARDYKAIALTDHVGIGYLDRIIREVAADCALARAHGDILAIPGVELTHIPPRAIGEAARRAKELGAWLVVVHGESIIEPEVEKGTNIAALQCPYVDILAHPGLITPEQAELAAANGIFLEISARKGHSLTNGHIAHLARLAGAKLLLNSDAHDETDLLCPHLARQIARGAGLNEEESDEILTNNAHALVKRLPQPR
ncbi:MAG: histidinol phosphate phosphatase domain-containing protein [Dehalococcoidia bacterium]|nr:histidinol phosphate phosphatase domain-containing protein [Dehalococcoidia bacterium]